MGLNSYFSGIPEDYSNYHWYKGENENPYKNDTSHPLAASFWEYERDFHFGYLDKADTKKASQKPTMSGKRNLSTSIYPVNLQIHTVMKRIGEKYLNKERGI